MLLSNGTTVLLSKVYSTYDMNWHSVTVDIGAHDSFKIQFIGTPTYLYWGMTAIDDIMFSNCDIGEWEFNNSLKLKLIFQLIFVKIKSIL